MATAGTIAVNVIANTSQFDRNINKSRNTIRTFGSELTDRLAPGLSGLAKMGPALAAAAVTAGAFAVAGTAAHVAIRSIGEALERVDALDDAAAKLGVTTEALSTFRYAAQFAGVSAEQLDTAVGMMNKNIANAARKGGDLGALFKRLGLDADKLVNAGPEEAFRQIADAVAGLENPMQRTQAAMAIFGRAGGALIPTLMEGSRGFDAMRREAQSFGLVVTQIDASRIAQANDALTRLRGISEGAANQFASQLAPAITLVTDRMAAFVIAGGGMDEIAEKWVGRLEKLVAAYLNWNDALDRLALNPFWQMLRLFESLDKGKIVMSNLGPLAGDRFLKDLEEAKRKVDEIARARERAGGDAIEDAGKSKKTKKADKDDWKNPALLKGTAAAYEGVVAAKQNALNQKNADEAKRQAKRNEDIAREQLRVLKDIAGKVGDDAPVAGAA